GQQPHRALGESVLHELDGLLAQARWPRERLCHHRQNLLQRRALQDAVDDTQEVRLETRDVFHGRSFEVRGGRELRTRKSSLTRTTPARHTGGSQYDCGTLPKLRQKNHVATVRYGFHGSARAMRASLSGSSASSYWRFTPARRPRSASGSTSWRP